MFRLAGKPISVLAIALATFWISSRSFPIAIVYWDIGCSRWATPETL